MPYVFGAKISTDVGNTVRAGSDSGLYVAPPQGDVNPGYVVDNYHADAGQTFSYQMGSGSSTNTVSFPAGTALLEPLLLTRPARLAGVSFYVSATATGNIYFSLYGANAATGWPAGKLYDLGSAGTGNTVVATAVPAAGVGALAARTVYWLAAWFNGTGSPTLYARGTPTLFPLRQNTMPTTITGGSFAWPDTSASWGGLTTGPAAVNPALTAATAAPGTTPPMWWLTLTNS